MSEDKILEGHFAASALRIQAEPRSILVSLLVEKDVDGLSAAQILSLALVANELATNAIEHAFEEGTPGTIRIVAGATDEEKTASRSMTMVCRSPTSLDQPAMVLDLVSPTV